MGPKIQAWIFTSIFEVKSWAQDPGPKTTSKIEVKICAYEVKICAYEVKIYAYAVKSCAHEVMIRAHEVKVSPYEVRCLAH